MLKAASWGITQGLHGSAPLKIVQVEDQKIVEPRLPVSSSEHEHLVLNNTGSMELPHWGLSLDDGRDIESQLVDSLLQVNEDHIGEHLEPVPASIDDDLASVPDLAGVAHSWLGQLVLLDLGLIPNLLFRIEDIEIIDNSFLAVALSASERNQVLPELGRAVAIPCRWRLRGGCCARVHLHELPGILLKVCILLLFAGILSSVLALDGGLP